MALAVLRNLDLLVESAAVQGQLAGGEPPAWVAAHSSLGRRAVAVLNGRIKQHGKSPTWSPDEDKFLKSNLGILSEEIIARRLGRTPVAVHLRWSRNLKLPPPSKVPGVITGNQIADTLGLDVHSVMKLIDRGILPGRRMPGRRVIRLVNRTTFARWAVNPTNWIYFKSQRVRDEHLRKLIELRRGRWDDEWWTTGKVGRYHHSVNSRLVNRDILQGKLPAVKWGNWHVLRSDAIRLRYFTGKGHGHERDWSERADVFLILAHAVGFSTNAIAAMCGWKTGAVSYRLAALRREKRISPLIRKHGLKVEVNARTGELFADWKCYRSRFPRLARAMDHLKRGDSMNKQAVLYARSILLKRARWNGDDNLVHALVGGQLSERRLRKAYDSMKKNQL